MLGTGGSFKLAALARPLGLACMCVSTVHVGPHPDSMCICNVMIASTSVLICPLTGLRETNFRPSSLVLNIGLVQRGQVWAALGRHSALAANPTPAPLYRLLVGAPQALALPGQQANRTGGLFACPLSLEETDCYRVDIDRGGVDPVGLGREHGPGRTGEDLASSSLSSFLLSCL